MYYYNGCLDESAGYRSRPSWKNEGETNSAKKVGLTNLRPITTIFCGKNCISMWITATQIITKGKTLGRLIEELDPNGHLVRIFSPREELTIVFSGGKGFHLVDTNSRTMDLIYDDEIRNSTGLAPVGRLAKDAMNVAKEQLGFDLAMPEGRQNF